MDICALRASHLARSRGDGQSIAQWKFDAPPAKTVTKAVAEFVIRDCQHPYVVEGEGFQRLLKMVEPRYVVPSRTYILKVRTCCFH